MTDSIIRVASPDGIAFDLHPAGAMIRVIALLLDSIFQVVAMLIILSILQVIGITGAWTTSLIGFAIIWFYMVVFEVLFTGRSPGKMILGLQVVLSDGSPINAGASILRNLLRVVDTPFAIGLIVSLFNTGFQRLGDIVAGTLVVYTPDRMTRHNEKQFLEQINPCPPQHILGPEAADIILSYARRQKSFSPELRKELSQAAVEAYLFNCPSEKAEQSALGLAAWYAGVRPNRKGDLK